ncbi:MAG: helix-turn-helix domain-containing protein [Ottowia sp.]|nr:helix-turn-helix domain-containing protein [Ottowia sp.]
MTLDEYLKKHGGIDDLRAAIGVKSDEQIRQWARGWQNRKPSPRNCVAIERATGGLVTRQELRPDDWREVWPEIAEQKPPPQGVTDVTLGDTSAFGQPGAQEGTP